LAQQQQQQGGGAGAGAGAAGAGGMGGLDIETLRNNPQFQQLRDLMQQNPALLQPIIQQLAAANPQLAQAITQNPELLMQLLGGGEGDEGDEGELPPGAHAIQVTPEERAAIERVRRF
jgi:UV excision repair protein RAD23